MGDSSSHLPTHSLMPATQVSKNVRNTISRLSIQWTRDCTSHFFSTQYISITLWLFCTNIYGPKDDELHETPPASHALLLLSPKDRAQPTLGVGRRQRTWHLSTQLCGCPMLGCCCWVLWLAARVVRLMIMEWPTESKWKLMKKRHNNLQNKSARMERN